MHVFAFLLFLIARVCAEGLEGPTGKRLVFISQHHGQRLEDLHALSPHGSELTNFT